MNHHLFFKLKYTFLEFLFINQNDEDRRNKIILYIFFFCKIRILVTLKGSEWNETLFLLIQVIYQEVVAPKVNIEDLVDLCFEEEFKKKVINS